MSGQGAWTIDPCAAISFMWKTVQSARKKRCHAHSCPVCSTVVWSSHSRGRIAVTHDTPAGKRCQKKHWHVPEKKARAAWQTAGLNALNNRGLWPECLVEAAAEGFRGFRGFRRLTPGKRQSWTPLRTEGWAWQTTGSNALNNRGLWP